MDKKKTLQSRLIDALWKVAITALPLILIEILLRVNHENLSYLKPPSGITEIEGLFPLVLLTFQHAAGTLLRTVVGFLLACVAGIIFGLTLGSNDRFYDRLLPSINFFRNIPSALLCPILVILPLFKTSATSYLFIIVFGSIWPVLLTTMDALRNIDDTMEDCLSQYNLPWHKKVSMFKLPSIAQEVFTSMKISLSISLILCVTAEMLIGEHVWGLGRLMLEMRDSGEFAINYFIPLVVGLIGLGLNRACQQIERRISWIRHRYENQRTQIVI